MKTIELDAGKSVIVDDEDYEKYARVKWRCVNGYASREVVKNRIRHRFYMHRMILNAPIGACVDHISGDKLDNRRTNLRLTNKAGNSANRAPSVANTSGYKGVSWSRGCNKWRAQIHTNHRGFYLGVFVSKVDAALAYDKKAREVFGPYAKLNFPEGLAR
jgi:hypothetical protein